MPIDTFVFDLDGTLIDTMPNVVVSFAYAMEPFQVPPSEEVIVENLGGPAIDCLRKLLVDERHLEEATRRFYEHNAAHRRAAPLFNGAIEMLDDLVANDRKVAIWTGRDRRTTEEIIERHELGEYFRQVVCGDDLQSYKPDPEGLLLIVDRFGSERERTFFVGDSDVDLLAGIACGVPTILIDHGRSIAPDLAKKAHFLVDEPLTAFGLCRKALK